jgi:hypothetical protein
VRVLDLLAPVLALDEVVHHAALDGTGTVERARGHDVFEAVGLQLLEQVAKARRFKLEHSRHVGGGDHPVHVGVVERNGRHVERGFAARLAVGVGQRDRGLNHGQGLEAEEVELDQAHLGHVVHVVLGGDHALFGSEARHVLPQGLLADDHARRVDAGVPVQPLQLHRDIEQVAVFPLIQRLEPRFFLDRFFDGRRLALHRLGDQGGHLVLLGHWQAHGAAHVADAAARLHLVHGHDLTRRCSCRIFG